MRLLAVSHNFNLEGAAISMFELLVKLKDKFGVEAHVVSLGTGPLRDRYLESGILVTDLPFDERWLRSQSKIHDAIHALTEFAIGNDYTAVYANTYLGYPAILAGARAGLPTIWNIRESQSESFWREYLGDRYALAIKAFESVNTTIFVSQSTRNLWAARVPLKNSHCIPNALDMQELDRRMSGISPREWRLSHGIEAEDLVFFCPGTLHERKGQLDLLRAVAQLPPQSTPVVALFVGDVGGEYSRKMHSEAASLFERGPHKAVILPREFYIADAYKAADVFVCCSRNESYPRIILEAMAWKLPIISTPVFGIAEQVEFGRSAVGYAPGDIRGLSERIQRLASDRSRRNELAAYAAKRLQALPNMNTVVGRYATVIKHTAETACDKGL